MINRYEPWRRQRTAWGSRPGFGRRRLARVVGAYAEPDFELPGHLVGGLLELVRVRRGGDALLEEDLVGLQSVAEDERSLADAVAHGLERLGREVEP